MVTSKRIASDRNPTMTIFTPEYAATKKKLADAFAAAGWTVASQRDQEISCLVAVKDYETAVGTKTATASLEPHFGKFQVVGNYQSEGRNILSTTWLDLTSEMSTEEVNARLAKHAAMVDAEVDGSYARRLHIRFPAEA